jgi:hypothetical protein
MLVPKVLIVIINYNGLSDTFECLESLRLVKGIPIRIVVLDNGSFDNSEAMEIQERFPEVLCIRSEINLGFAAGCNRAIKIGLQLFAPDFVLLLNNDTVVHPSFLGQMVKAAKANRRIGIVGPKILYYARKKVIQTTGGRMVWWLGLTWNIGADRFDCKKFDLRSYRDWVSGCAMLIKTEVIQKIGFLNEFFFQGNEDYEYCYRARSKGYDVVYEPSAMIWHKVSKSSRREFRQVASRNILQSLVAYMNLFRSISPHPVISAIASVFVGFPIQTLKYLLITKDEDLRNYYRRKFVRSISSMFRKLIGL